MFLLKLCLISLLLNVSSIFGKIYEVSEIQQKNNENILAIKSDGKEILLDQGNEAAEDPNEDFELIEVKNGTVVITDQVKTTKQSGCQYTFSFQRAGQTAILNSPNHPNDYPANSDCKYFIDSPQDTVIDLDCQDFHLEASNNCQYDIFYVSLSGDRNFNDATYACGSGTYTRSSKGNKLSIGFRSDDSNPPTSRPYRFQCKMTARSLETCSCGTSAVTRIVGGSETQKGAYPHRCALYTQSQGVFCGCSIISKTWVLTAAHCTNALPQRETLYVNIGDHDLSSNSEAVNRVIKVNRIVQNALYNDKNKDYDIAVLELSETIQFAQNVQPVCLPWKYRNSNFNGATLVASGWGTTSFGGPQSTVLMHVSLPYLSTEDCRNYYGSAITNNMFCTYQQGRDTCQGDSGGSVDFREGGTGRYYSMGITSWGVGCGSQNQPGVYTKITNFLDWIQGNTGEDFCKI